MAKMTTKQLAAWECKRDLNAELLETIDDLKTDRWVRKTEFLPMADGRLRRRVTRNDGTIEHDEVIPAGRIHIAAARAGTGLSQSQFAQLLGVSVRTLQDWESGRRNPSGAAQTLLRIASKHPRVVREVAA
mgnify:CR=1 FL=1